MEKSTNEILFNKAGKRAVVKKKSSEAKKLLQLLTEYESQQKLNPEVIINLYSKKIQTSKSSIQNKLDENKLRPFEFYVIQN